MLQAWFFLIDPYMFVTCERRKFDAAIYRRAFTFTTYITFPFHSKNTCFNRWTRLKVLYLNCIFFFVTDDLSFKKNATQSTEAWSYDFYKAGNAVDRNISTCMRTQEIGRNSPEKTVWWKVDLGGMHNIYSVNILFKNYNGYGKNTADFKHI